MWADIKILIEELFSSVKKYILSRGVFDFSIEDDDTINNIALAGDGDPVGVVGT